MEFKVLIDQFEGPLDLMLHLIRENKLDLFDSDMNILTEQYLVYLERPRNPCIWKLLPSISVSLLRF